MQPASNLLKSDPQLDALKVPPQSLEAEQSVLGGLMLDEWLGGRGQELMAQGGGGPHPGPGPASAMSHEPWAMSHEP